MNHLSYYYKRVNIERFKKPADFYFMMDTKDFSAASLNPLLEERLQLLKRERERVETQNNYDRVRQSVDFVNDILYGVISHHAADFNGVEINASLLDAANVEVGRGILKDHILKLSGEKPRDGTSFRFVAHLPYHYKRGEYFGAVQSDSVLFKPGYEKSDPFASLAVDLSGGYGPMASNPVHLSLDEIKSDGVRLVLVPDSEFSPFWKNWNRDWNAPPSALLHYAKFRGFREPFMGEARKVEAEITSAGIEGGSTLIDRIKPLIENIWLPDTNPPLLEINGCMVKGMAIVNVDGELRLYEFPYSKSASYQAESLPGANSRVYVADLVSQHNAAPFQYVKVYTGHDVVKRIHQEFAGRK